MNKITLKKTTAIIGIIIVISHLTFYFLRPYNVWLFFIGFGIIWLIFLWLPKQLEFIKY